MLAFFTLLVVFSEVKTPTQGSALVILNFKKA